jgi:regulator of sigma E protease
VITTLIAFAFVLGVLVFVHELGHFLAAKRIGIKVLKFQLGFNPTIVSVRRGDTEYGIGALPLGGYVKMAGENPEETRTGAPDEFLSRTKWERFQVLIMGPTMNLLMAVGLTAVVLYHGAEAPIFEDQPPVVGAVTAGSPAAQADIRPGDRIMAVADRKVDTWQDVFLAIGTRSDRPVSVKLMRNGVESTRTVVPVSNSRSRYDIGDIGVQPTVRPKLIAVNAGQPAERGGLKRGDVVLAVDGQPMNSTTAFRDVIAKHPGQPITISVLRADAPVDLTVTPVKQGSIGWIGVGIGEETKSIKPGPFQAIEMSVQENVRNAGLIFRTVWGLITLETSPKQLMGPVAIAQMSGESAELGWVALFSLMAMISLNLGLLNLLPIPILDGGHIAIMALEGVARRDFSIRVKEKMLLAGFVVLMMLMVTAIYNDLTRVSWIGRFMPWR